MKIYSFLFKVLSLLPMNNIETPVLHHHIFENVVCVSEIMTPLKDIQILEDKQEDDRLWIHFRSSHKFEPQLDNLVTVDIPKLYKTVVTSKYNTINRPQEHIDQYKYSLFSSHRFSNYISYDEFCHLEYLIADIIQSYIDDKTTEKSIGIVIDEIFLQPDSVFYKRNGKNPSINTMLTKKYFSKYPTFVLIDTSTLDIQKI